MQMISRLATLSISLVAVVGMLHTSVVPAAACSCAVISDDEGVRGIMDHYALVVEGTLGPYEDSGVFMYLQPEVLYRGDVIGNIVLDQTWDSGWDGGGGTGYSSIGADCRYILMGEPGDRYVLFLEPNPVSIGDTVVGGPKGTYRASGCSSFAIGELEGPNAWEGRAEQYEAIKRVSDGGNPPGVAHQAPPPPIEEEVQVFTPESTDATGERSIQEQARESKNLPWVPILIIALAIPTAALVVPSFFGKKGSGDH